MAIHVDSQQSSSPAGWLSNWIASPPFIKQIYMKRKEITMEKAFAYVCASSDAAPRLLKRYCRKIYELGYVPICPKLSDSQYLQMENADEKREFQNISRQKLCRCRMLVVCGNEISNSMSAEIGDWFCKHSVWISKRILGRTPNPRHPAAHRI